MNGFKSLFQVLVLLAGCVLCTQSAWSKAIVSAGNVPRGAIVIKTSERKLYFGLGGGKAIRYSVGVGRAGRQWSGRRWISAKTIKPAWRATPAIRRDKPGTTRVIPGGSPRNPMGAAALLISGRGQYAIHGTNDPASIGRFVSYGCIRMHNEEILDLFSRVRIGTRVIVSE